MSIWHRRNHSRDYIAKDDTSIYTVKMYQMKPNVCSFHVECNIFKFLISSTRPLHARNDRVIWNTAEKIPFLPLFLSNRCFTFEKIDGNHVSAPVHLHDFFHVVLMVNFCVNVEYFFPLEPILFKVYTFQTFFPTIYQK